MPAKNHLKNEHKNFNVNYEITKNMQTKNVKNVKRKS